MQPPDRSTVAWDLNSVAIHLLRRTRMADQALGVPPGQLSALSVLVFGGERTIGQLATIEQVTSPTMTRIVDGLEKAGLVYRRPHPGDRRASIVAATTEGRSLMEKGRQRRVAVISALLEGLSSADLEALDRGTRALERSLRAQNSPRR